MKALHLSTLSILLILLFGCSPHSQLTQSNPTPTFVSPMTIPMTATHMVNTPTAAILPTATITIPAFEEKCVKLVEKLPADALEGVVVLNDWKTSSLILRNTNSRTQIPSQPSLDNYIAGPYVSPDGKQLMYEAPSRKLIIMGSNLSTLSQFDIRNIFYEANNFPIGKYQWLGTNFVRFSIKDLNGKLITRVLDIHSGDLQELKTDFPDLVNRTKSVWDIYGVTVHAPFQGGDVLYDPTLKRVLYPKTDGTVVLYDAEKDVELAATQLNDSGMSPSWSPDGRYVVITSRSGLSQGNLGDEFYIVPRDGPHFTRLTYLGNTYGSDYIKSYSWSPDSNRIAFWMKPPDKSEYSLAVTDVASGNVVDYCITGLATSFSFNLTPDSVSPTLLGVSTGKPIWSPDGTKLLISQWDAEKKRINIILVDISQQIAYPFLENLDPIGWINSHH